MESEIEKTLMSVSSVIILRALKLGDMLCAIPAFRALRAALPKARITLAGLPWEKQLVDRYCHYLDDFIEFPGFPGFPERTPLLDQIPSFVSEVQSRHYDLALQLQGSGSISNPLVMLFGARLTAGFCEPASYCPDNSLFMKYPEDEPEICRHLDLLDHLGLPLQGDALEFPLYAQDWQEYEALERQCGMRRGAYAVIHAGSSKAERRWPLDRFSAVGDELAERGLQIVLTGTAEETSLTRAVALQMHHPAINLVGKTNLGSLGAVVKSARVVVSNDTGVSHLADALKVPSVVLFTADDADRWAPLDKTIHHVLHNAPAIPPAMVMKEIDSLLVREQEYAF
jgi:ADP-heptose:LPS heptosyltransferase